MQDTFLNTKQTFCSDTPYLHGCGMLTERFGLIFYILPFNNEFCLIEHFIVSLVALIRKVGIR